MFIIQVDRGSLKPFECDGGKWKKLNIKSYKKGCPNLRLIYKTLKSHNECYKMKNDKMYESRGLQEFKLLI